MKVIAVDKNDNQKELVEKVKAHKQGVLHRAFSIFVFNNQGELLIQKRSAHKKLWPGYWSNTVCSHPNAKCAKEKRRKNAKKNVGKQAEKRLKQEMGFTTDLKFVYKFDYQADFEDKGSENELCYVFLGRYNGQKIKPNPKEVADFKWVKYPSLINQIREKPEDYTPWFKMEFKELFKEGYFDE